MALVTQTVVGNQEKKMLCYTVAIDNFPQSHPKFFWSHQPTTRRLWLCDNFISFFNYFSVACSAMLLRWRLVKMLKMDSDRRLTSLLN